MTDGSTTNLGDLFAVFGTSNPLAGVSRSIEQFRRGVGELVATVETMRTTVDNLNEITARVNRLLDDVEEPVRAAMPQVTRAVKLANVIVDQMVEPIERIAPNLNRLADTLASPTILDMPSQIGDFLEVLGDLAKRLRPLGQMAETASGLFGLRGFGALSGSSRTPAPTRSASPPHESPAPVPPRLAAPKSVVSKSAASTSETSKSVTKKAPSKPVTKKAPSKSVANRAPSKSVAKKAPSKSVAKKRAAPAKRSTS
jgi:ABC-type transporter Mla subunit MlaD